MNYYLRFTCWVRFVVLGSLVLPAGTFVSSTCLSTFPAEPLLVVEETAWTPSWYSLSHGNTFGEEDSDISPPDGGTKPRESVDDVRDELLIRDLVSTNREKILNYYILLIIRIIWLSSYDIGLKGCKEVNRKKQRYNMQKIKNTKNTNKRIWNENK